MNLLTISDLEELLDERPGPCLSIFLRTDSTGPRRPQGPTRLRNLLVQANAELAAMGVGAAAIEDLIGPLDDLAVDPSFWNTQELGIALFRAPGFTRAYHVPAAFAERCQVGEHFFLKPLLPLVAAEGTFFVLALSQNEVRLLEATCRSVRRPAVAGLPQNLTAALGAQTTSQSLQYHTASPSGAGALPAIVHGRGGSAGETKEELHRYLRQVESAMRKFLAGRTEPLVLAAAEPLAAIYKEISGSPHLAATVIAGNPEHLRDEELRDRAWQILQPAFEEGRRRAAERFAELAGTGRASNDATEILPAARQGRVESLFLACDADLWGRLDDRLGSVELHASPEKGDEDLLDSAAILSLRHGGTVYGVDHDHVPGGGQLAAVFRY